MKSSQNRVKITDNIMNNMTLYENVYIFKNSIVFSVRSFLSKLSLGEVMAWLRTCTIT